MPKYEFELTEEELTEVDDLTENQAQLGSTGRRDRIRELAKKMKNHILELRPKKRSAAAEEA
jgi:hypothetical protein